MRVLVLDDDDQRHSYFAKQFANDEIVHTHTIDEFRDALKEARFDYIFLDHDLNDFPKYKSLGPPMSVYSFRRAELTGENAAVMVVKLSANKRPKTAVVHSWNPPGAMKMMEILRDGGVNALRWEFDPKKDIVANNGKS